MLNEHATADPKPIDPTLDEQRLAAALRSMAARYQREIAELETELKSIEELANQFKSAEGIGLGDIVGPVNFVCLLLDRLTRSEADSARMRAQLERNRQGLLNILEFRRLNSEKWGQRDGYGGRYGALTRDEIETAVADIDSALGAESQESGPADSLATEHARSTKRK